MIMSGSLTADGWLLDHPHQPRSFLVAPSATFIARTWRHLPLGAVKAAAREQRLLLLLVLVLGTRYCKSTVEGVGGEPCERITAPLLPFHSYISHKLIITEADALGGRHTR